MFRGVEWDSPISILSISSASVLAETWGWVVLLFLPLSCIGISNVPRLHIAVWNNYFAITSWWCCDPRMLVALCISVWMMISIDLWHPLAVGRAIKSSWRWCPRSGRTAQRRWWEIGATQQQPVLGMGDGAEAEWLVQCLPVPTAKADTWLPWSKSLRRALWSTVTKDDSGCFGLVLKLIF